MTETSPPDLRVPRGPGVVPPFPAPPVEGRTARVWAGLGIGAAALLLLGGGGIAAVIGLAVTGSKAIGEQVGASITAYFDAVGDKRYSDAYRMLCDRAQDAETPAEFTARAGATEPWTRFAVGDIALTSTEPRVPVTLTRGDGSTDTVQVTLVQDRSTGKFEVCGVEE
jgi:hypothetical protein